MPAGGKRRDYTYETSSLSILCIPCASRRLRIEECSMTATWLLPCGRPNITALTGKKKRKRKSDFSTYSSSSSYLHKSGFNSAKISPAGARSKITFLEVGRWDWACPHRRFCGVLRVRNEQHQKTGVSLPNRSETVPCKGS